METAQKISRRVQTFTDKYPYVGPAAWITSLQYFIVQIVAATAWNTPFSTAVNPISDLGNTACGVYGGRFVCSPLHGLMNMSFVLLGITMMIGAALIYQEFKETTYSAVGFTFMGLAAFGTLLIGLFPENTVALLHLLGAFLPFVLGNIGLIILGTALDIPRWLRLFTLTLGIVALASLPILIFQMRIGTSIGTVERLVAYPQTIWLIAFGIYISRDHYVSAKVNS